MVKDNTTKVLTKNSARCRLCRQVLVSKHAHDFQRCLCGAIAIDGGTHYQRCVGNFLYFEDLSEYTTIEAHQAHQQNKPVSQTFDFVK